MESLLSEEGLSSDTIDGNSVQHAKLFLHFLLDPLVDNILPPEVLFDGHSLFLRKLNDEAIYELIQPLQSLDVHLEVNDLIEIYVEP